MTGDTAFHYACNAGQQESMETLMAVGCNPALRSYDGKTGEQLATKQGHTALVKRLKTLQWELSEAAGKAELARQRALEKSASTAASRVAGDVGEMVGAMLLDPDLSSYLVLAVFGADWDKVKRLLEDGADPSKPVDPDMTLSSEMKGMTPLAMAAMMGHTKILRLLLEYGADIDAVVKQAVFKQAEGFTAFLFACETGSLGCVKELLKHGCDHTLTTTAGRTGLQLAQAHKHTAVVKLLMKDGKTTEPDLVLAVFHADQKEVKRLLEDGANPSKPVEDLDADPLTAAAAAAYTGPEPAAAVAAAMRGVTPVSMAVTMGYAKILRLLLDYGADIDAVQTLSGSTAFHIACEVGSLGCVKELLKHGCDHTLTTNAGWTGLQLAQENEHTAVVKRLMKLRPVQEDIESAENPPQPDLFLAIFQADQKEVKRLLEDGADPSKPVEDLDADPLTAAAAAVAHNGPEPAAAVAAAMKGMTPLTIAAMMKYTKILRLLLEYGADIDAVHDDHMHTPLGFTAFLFACKTGSLGCVKELLKHGCDHTLTTTDGRTGLQLAQKNEHTAVVKLLMKLRPVQEEQPDTHQPRRQASSLKSEPSELSTMLFDAIKPGNLSLVRRLLDAGADPNTTEFKLGEATGFTPLMLAAVNGHAKILTLLLQYGAHIDAAATGEQNYGSYSAFHFACDVGQKDCMEVLMKHGCDYALETFDGMTGMQLAKASIANSKKRNLNTKKRKAFVKRLAKLQRNRVQKDSQTTAVADESDQFWGSDSEDV